MSGTAITQKVTYPLSTVVGRDEKSCIETITGMPKDFPLV